MNYDINNCQLGVPAPKAHLEGAPKAWPTTSAHAIRNKVHHSCQVSGCWSLESRAMCLASNA